MCMWCMLTWTILWRSMSGRGCLNICKLIETDGQADGQTQVRIGMYVHPTHSPPQTFYFWMRMHPYTYLCPSVSVSLRTVNATSTWHTPPQYGQSKSHVHPLQPYVVLVSKSSLYTNNFRLLPNLVSLLPVACTLLRPNIHERVFKLYTWKKSIQI